VTTESDVLWILLSGRLCGRAAPQNAFPHVEGELALRLAVFESWAPEAPKAHFSELLAPTKSFVPEAEALRMNLEPTWGPGESYLSELAEGSVQSLS
jgi:hypothetical protein